MPAFSSAPDRFEANWDSLDRRRCPEWYLDAKFGIFIHWGIYAVPAWGPPQQYAEWYWRHWRNESDRTPDKEWKSEELLAWVFNESPSRAGVVVNDRWGKDARHKHGTYVFKISGGELVPD